MSRPDEIECGVWCARPVVDPITIERGASGAVIEITELCSFWLRAVFARFDQLKIVEFDFEVCRAACKLLRPRTGRVPMIKNSFQIGFGVQGWYAGPIFGAGSGP